MMQGSDSGAHTANTAGTMGRGGEITRCHPCTTMPNRLGQCLNLLLKFNGIIVIDIFYHLPKVAGQFHPFLTTPAYWRLWPPWLGMSEEKRYCDYGA